MAEKDVRADIEGAPEVEPVATRDNVPIIAPVAPPPPDGAGGPRVICLMPGELPRVVDESDAALAAANLGLYVRAHMVVRPCLARVPAADGRQTFSYRLAPVKAAHIRECMTRAARYEKHDARAKKYVPADCPKDVAETYLARETGWRLPPLTGVITAPTLRADGSLLLDPGYDPATGLLFEPRDASFPAIATRPTRDDALEALMFIKRSLREFPFVSAEDCAVALSAFCTALTRRTMSLAPVHCVRSHAPGSGKSYLLDCVSALATGEPMAVISQARKEEETEKRLAASLIAGDSMISLDNCRAPLGGGLLAVATTQPLIKVRILGLSMNAELVNNSMLTATGNNLALLDDMARRVLLSTLDAGCERPELRRFEDDLFETIRRHRGKFVAAFLTILLAYHVAGYPDKLVPIASFGQWSDRVRSALVWMGEADPAKTMESARKADVALNALKAVLEQWHQVIGEACMSSRKISERACEETISQSLTSYCYPDFREALLAVAGDSGRINTNRLGKWLLKIEGRIVDGRQVVQTENRAAGVAHWQLRSIEPFER